MPTYKAPVDDALFLLNDVFNYERYGNLPGFADATPDVVKAILEEGGKFAEEVLQPLNQIGDRQGCKRGDDGAVTTPEGFKEAYGQMAEAGWIGLIASPDYGGQGLPYTLGVILNEFISSANMAFGMYPGLSNGAYAALARHFRSHNRLDGELRTGLWTQLRDHAHSAGLGDPGERPFLYPQLVYWRDQVMQDEERREALLAAFTDVALDHARQRGLLLHNGAGSLTHPHPTRIIYGDGTVVRPIYRRPRTTTITDPDSGEETVVFVDPGTGEPLPAPPGRWDPSAADYHRHDGPIHGNNFVIVFARDHAPGSRVILGVDRVDAPGREADTAVALMERIHTAAASAITQPSRVMPK